MSAAALALTDHMTSRAVRPTVVAAGPAGARQDLSSVVSRVTTASRVTT